MENNNCHDDNLDASIHGNRPAFQNIITNDDDVIPYNICKDKNDEEIVYMLSLIHI